MRHAIKRSSHLTHQPFPNPAQTHNTELRAWSRHQWRSIDHSVPFLLRREGYIWRRIWAEQFVWYAAVSRYDMHAGQLWRRAWRDGGRQRWDTSLMTFSSGWVAVKGERSNSLPVASLSTRLNLPSKDSSRWWRNQKRKPGSRNLVESAFKHSGGRRRNLRIWSENVTSTQRVSQHQQTPADILWTHSCI